MSWSDLEWVGAQFDKIFLRQKLKNLNNIFASDALAEMGPNELKRASTSLHQSKMSLNGPK